jgi:hypothetical protein
MAKAAKLKVFSMAAGFHDAVVAAPSQKAALKAWGTTTDLFAAGRACVVENEALIAQALAQPGVVVKVARGDEAAMLGPEPAQAADDAKRRREPRKRPPPDRTALDAAEKAVAEAEQHLDSELAALAERRAELDRREREVRQAAEQRLGRLRDERDGAAAAFARAVERSRRPVD